MKDLEKVVKVNVGKEKKFKKRQEEMFARIIPLNRVAVCEKGKEIVGLIYWNNEFLGRSQLWYLEQMTVDEKYRRMGIGRGLIEFVKKRAKRNKIEKLFADAQNKNIASILLCLRTGGLISGTIEGILNSKEKDERIFFRFELQ
ncbi:MAG: GNAT family N-acetyltransferase [Candidatus Diapherotrites archaeon]|nr:GNAT family N-acetyltransferase [Candidatus Diapherotrites archaeon]